MFGSKQKKFVLSNSTMFILGTASKVLQYLSPKTPFEILHGTVRMKEENKDLAQASTELKVLFEKIALTVKIRMLIEKKEGLSWSVVPNSTIIISYKEGTAFGLVMEKTNFAPSTPFCEDVIKRMRSSIDEFPWLLTLDNE